MISRFGLDGVLDGESECMEQNGVLAMTIASTDPMEAFVPEMMVFGLPCFAAPPVFGPLPMGRGKELLHKGGNRNMYGLRHGDARTRNFYTKDRMMRSPEDLKGLKIRTGNNPMPIKWWKCTDPPPPPFPEGS